MGNFVDIKGKMLVVNNREIRFRGINAGNWLNIEGFMIGMPYVEHKMREIFADEFGVPLRDRFFKSYLDSYLAEPDFKFMAKIGFNLLRVPFNYRLFETDMEPGRYDARGFEYLDRVVRWGKKYGVYILLDFHAAPGSQSEDWHSDNATTEPRFFEVAAFQDRAVALWKTLARRYCREEFVMGYDLLNEPNTRHHDRLNAYYRAATAAIRSVDKNHVIVVEGSRWSDDIATLEKSLFNDRRTMPSFHHYPFFGIKKYPGPLNGKSCDRKLLMESMKDKFKFYDEVNRPMLLGECGFTARKPFNGPYEILRELLHVMEEKKISWTLWSYKDVGVMGFVAPHPDTPWMKFIRRGDINKGLQKRHLVWARMRESFKKIYAVVPEPVRTVAAKQVARGIEHLELYHFYSELKKCGRKQIAAMPASFLFKNCAPNPKAQKLIAELFAEISKREGVPHGA